MTYGSNPAGRYVAVDDIQLYIEESPSKPWTP